MNFPDIAAVAFLGLVLGSFATALAYRLPRDISILKRTRSQCPSCAHALGVRDLVPLFSWIFLKGKCRHCFASIGPQYPLIELATLLLCVLFYGVYGLSLASAAVFVLAPVFVSLIDIDLRYKILPDGLNLTILFAGILALAVNAILAGQPAAFIEEQGGTALLGALLYGGGSLLLRQSAQILLKREAMGLGDIKFFTAAGFWMGTNPDAMAAFLLISGLSGIIMALAWKKRTGEAEVPFGPSLIIAFIAVLALFPAGFMPT